MLDPRLLRSASFRRANLSASAPASTPTSRQFGAVLGTAILIAIAGTPTTLHQALAHKDAAYVFAICASLASGLVSLTFTRVRSGDAVDRSAYRRTRAA